MTNIFKYEGVYIKNLRCYKLEEDDSKLCRDTLKQYLPNLQSSERFIYPGPLPVSINKTNIRNIIKKNNYYISEKNDGERICCLFSRIKGHKIAIGFCRKGNAYILPSSKYLHPDIFHGTVLDCEVISNNNKAGLMIFDVMVVNGQNIEDLSYSTRMTKGRELFQSYKVSTSDKFEFMVKQVFSAKTQMKEFISHYYDIQDVRDVDGFIFTPDSQRVVYNRHTHMFKWKSPEKNTIDFHFFRGNLYIYNSLKKENEFVGKGIFEIPIIVNDGDIVECQYKDEGIWSILKVRHDKHRSNDKNTLMSTLQTIKQNITLKTLLELLNT